MKKIVMVLLILVYAILPSHATFAQTAEDSGLSSEIKSDESYSESQVQGMENAMDSGSPDMND